MKKTLKKTLCLFMMLLLLAATVVPVLAAEENTPSEETTEPADLTQLTISSEKEFLKFAQNCQRDSYSRNLKVTLQADLVLTNWDFNGIPTFSGIFDGNNHTISGMSIHTEGSVQGLFRYLTKTACVQNLNLRGAVHPEGSRKHAGGIAGDNAGRIENCTFQGEVSGADYIGGLVGTNQVSGIIENCQVFGSIHGNHFVGGIAGQNFGLIRSCSNNAGINKTANQNDVSPTDISADTIIGTESANTVTDVGGVSGINTGVIRACENHGTVGYQHMGYNIGGITGNQRGYIAESRNYANISGRKEIAGIAGQMEPVSKIEYSADTLQVLRQQLADTSALANQASSNMHSNAQNLSGQISSLHDNAETAIDAVTQLIPDAENPSLPDIDSILAAENTLTSSMSSMQSSISSINSTASATVSTAASDIRAITEQIAAISNTLDGASDNLGGTVTDVSDQDTAEDLAGKIEACENFGIISGDLNIGGIVGSVSWENDLDPEEDYQIIGTRSLNFERELRAVILNCKNSAFLNGKKQNIGGIAGNLSMGLIRNCLNSGRIEGEKADYLGGIAGTSSGYIRSSYAKCQILGNSCVGGIAGDASILSDCISMTEIEGGSEKLGSILGVRSETTSTTDNPVFHNYYLPGSVPLGAVDGIDYSEIADSVSTEQFLKLENIPEIFTQASLIFLFPDDTSKVIEVPLGTAADSAAIPPVPEQEGYIAKWQGLDDIDLSNVRFDAVLEPEYTPCRKVIQTEHIRDNGTPVMLAEGLFGENTVLQIQALMPAPALPDEMEPMESWQLPDFGTDAQTQLRLSMPEDITPDCGKIFVQNSDGNWREAETTANGSFLVFQVRPGDQAISLVHTPENPYPALLIALGAAVLALAVVILIIVRHHRRKKNPSTSKEQTTPKEPESQS